VLEEGDTFESHIEDTMVAGAGLNNRETVEFVVENAPAAIEHLAQLGVPFTAPGDADARDNGGRWHLTREGGHSHRRIVHVDDATGWAVQDALVKAAIAHPNIRMVPDMVAIDLATSRHELRYSGAGHVWGCYAVNRRTSTVELFTAVRPCSPPAARGAPTCSPPRRAGRPATASRWHGAPAAASPTWSSCSSTRPASTIWRSRTS
jgi:L-aspartate oxidase